MIRTKGVSLELFYIDGNPEGMLTAEVFNWKGHVLMTPRTQLKDALRRKEASFTGVYLLLGDKEGEPFIYIGEGEDMGSRIRSHDAKRDWWSNAVLITSASDNLNKAHVKYLEARLVEQASTVGKILLENSTTPTRASLSPAAQANMESFLEYVMLVLPSLRIDCFVQKTRPKIATDLNQDIPSSPVFEIFVKKDGIHATAVLSGADFIVQAGSKARVEWVGSTQDKAHYFKLHKELADQGILELRDGYREFTENYAFSSTSAAGSVVRGTSCAGPRAWKVQGTKKTYKKWEAEQLNT